MTRQAHGVGRGASEAVLEEQVRFPVGSIMLEGLLSLPGQPAKVGVVVCHPHPLRGGEMRNNVVEAIWRVSRPMLPPMFRGRLSSG